MFGITKTAADLESGDLTGYITADDTEPTEGDTVTLEFFNTSLPRLTITADDLTPTEGDTVTLETDAVTYSKQWISGIDGSDLSGETGDTTTKEAVIGEAFPKLRLTNDLTGKSRVFSPPAISVQVQQALFAVKPSGLVSALSLNKLFADYSGPLLRVRNATSNAEVDVESSGSYCDLAAIADHCGVDDGLVAKWYDQSGNSADWSQADESRMPRIYSAGYFDSLYGLAGVRFGLDGTKRLEITSPVVAAADAGYTVFHRYSMADTGNFPCLMTSNPSAGNPFIAHDSEAMTDRAATFYTSGGPTIINALTSIDAVRVRCDVYARNGTQKIRRNGVEVASGSTLDADMDVSASGNFLGHGGNDAGFTALPGLIDTVLVFNRVLTTEEIEEIEAVLTGAEFGSAPSGNSVTPTVFRDSISNVDLTTHIAANPFSRFVFSTTATQIVVNMYTNYLTAYPTLTRIGVHVDGVYRDSLRPTAEGLNSQRIFLGPGNKEVALVNGPQSVPGSVIGTWVKSITANAAITPLTPTQTGGLLVYGDSIAVGSAADPVMESSWFAIVREAYSGPSCLEATGSRQLYDDAASGTLRAAFVARLATLSPSIIWLAIGTNDYNFANWNATDFGTAYAALLSDIHTALPSAQIYAQTPLTRFLETANLAGSTCGDYRTAISTAASGKAYVTVVDGSAILSVSDLADGVHPTTAGHALVAAAVISELGL